MNHKKYVLDSYAILALLEGESGAETVANIVGNDESKIYLSIINLGEIYYILFRRKGKRTAEEIVDNILSEDSLTVVDAPWSRVKVAAAIKTRGGLSYADAFVLALGKELEAPVVTGDPEIRLAAAGFSVEIIWIGK